jgi:hypothetical protein
LFHSGVEQISVYEIISAGASNNKYSDQRFGRACGPCGTSKSGEREVWRNNNQVPVPNEACCAVTVRPALTSAIRHVNRWSISGRFAAMLFPTDPVRTGRLALAGPDRPDLSVDAIAHSRLTPMMSEKIL